MTGFCWQCSKMDTEKEECERLTEGFECHYETQRIAATPKHCRLDWMQKMTAEEDSKEDERLLSLGEDKSLRRWNTTESEPDHHIALASCPVPAGPVPDWVHA